MAIATKTQTTTTFMNGGSQAVRIPASYRFDEKELYINKIGHTLLLTPVSYLKNTLSEGAAMIPDDFMENGMPDEIHSEREEL